jgi:hypothetical protein
MIENTVRKEMKMNEYEISKLNFEQALEHFGDPIDAPVSSQIVLSVQYRGSFGVDEPIRGQHSVLVCRVRIVDDEKEEVVVDKIDQIFENDGHFPISGEDSIPLSELRKSAQDRIAESRSLGLD